MFLNSYPVFLKSEFQLDVYSYLDPDSLGWLQPRSKLTETNSRQHIITDTPLAKHYCQILTWSGNQPHRTDLRSLRIPSTTIILSDVIQPKFKPIPIHWVELNMKRIAQVQQNMKQLAHC